MATVHEQLSEQFHNWEKRGRGWQIFPDPIYPEPPFVPFEDDSLPEQPVIDDGRRPTILSSLFKAISRKLNPEVAPISTEEEDEPEPVPLVRDSLVELRTSLPETLEISDESFKHFLSSLHLCREPVSFELLGGNKRVGAQFAAHRADAPLLRRQLKSYFPEALFLLGEGTLEKVWGSSEGDEALAVEFGLGRELMLPLAPAKVDPFIGIIGALSELEAGEFGLFQVLWQPVQNDWPESIMRSVTHSDGRPFFLNRPELKEAAEHKIAAQIYATIVRFLLRVETPDRLWQLARDLAGSLRVFGHPKGNELIPLQNDNYPFEDHINDVLRRQTRRTGMLLNSQELIGFVHIPADAVRAPALIRDAGTTKSAPSPVRRCEGLLLGINEHAGESVEVRLTPEQRVRHCHIIGASGTGKSTLLFNLIKQDIDNGQGVAVLDPHGDLVDHICGIIPPTRVDDVLLVDPADEEYSVGFNVLSAHSDLEKHLLASDLVSVFERLSTTWGDQMNSVLQNAILAVLENDRGGTIADVRRFLLEHPFRVEFLKSVRDSEVVYYWQKGFPQLAGNRSIGSILTRLDMFLAQKPIRYMVSQPENKLDFAKIMDGGKILLAKLPEGLLGKENSYLLGTLLVSKFQQVAMSRQAQQVGARRDFWLYIDEFANFITPSMAEILAGARKYRIGLTLAHQELHQLQRNPDVASAVLSHPFTRVVFRVGDDDARKLSEGFSFFKAEDLRNLDIGHAICRVERSDYDFNLSVPVLPDRDQGQTAAQRQQVIASSRSKYGTLKSAVEALMAKSRAPATAVPAVTSKAVAPQAPEQERMEKTSHAVRPAVDSSSPKLPETAVTPPRTAPSTPEHVEEAASGQKVSRSALPSRADESLHLRIKEQIGKGAEALDFTVSYEEPVPGGGRIDLVLRRGKRTIACEISVKNAVEYEAQNVSKCIASGFTQVVVVSPKKSKLSKIEEVVRATLPAKNIERVSFRLPEELMEELTEWASEDPDGGAAERAQPRKRRISWAGGLDETELKEHESAMLKRLARAMKE